MIQCPGPPAWFVKRLDQQISRHYRVSTGSCNLGSTARAAIEQLTPHGRGAFRGGTRGSPCTSIRAQGRQPSEQTTSKELSRQSGKQTYTSITLEVRARKRQRAAHRSMCVKPFPRERASLVGEGMGEGGKVDCISLQCVVTTAAAPTAAPQEPSGMSLSLPGSKTSDEHLPWLPAAYQHLGRDRCKNVPCPQRSDTVGRAESKFQGSMKQFSVSM